MTVVPFPDAVLRRPAGRRPTSEPADPTGRLPTRHLGQGLHDPALLGAQPGDEVTLLVCEGLLLVDVRMGGTVATEIVGPGDFLQVGAAAGDLVASQWTLFVPGTARVAVLGRDLDAILERWPEVGRRLVRSGAARARRQLLHRAACQMPRVEDRVLAILWLLAERWGEVTDAGGVELRFAITHELLGRLVGARRPTVTMALGQLVEIGHLRRPATGRLVLSPASRSAVVRTPERAVRTSGAPDVRLRA